jgi:hypothetical protein
MWADSRPILNLRGLLNDSKMVVRAAQMMLKTGLLEQFKQVDPATFVTWFSASALRTFTDIHDTTALR